MMLAVLMTGSLMAQSATTYDYDIPLSWSSPNGSNFNFKIYVASGGTTFVLNQTVTNALSTTLKALPLDVTNSVYVTQVDRATGIESPASPIITSFISLPKAPFNLNFGAATINIHP